MDLIVSDSSRGNRWPASKPVIATSLERISVQDPVMQCPVTNYDVTNCVAHEERGAAFYATKYVIAVGHHVEIHLFRDVHLMPYWP
jgi:hypothetical protein